MLAVAILAAGKGTRMKSQLPKVLQSLAGKSLIERVLASVNGLKPDRVLLIVGHQAELIKEKLCHIPELEFINQVPQKGTGHAIQQLIPVLKDFEGELLVLNGDVPLLSKTTIARLIHQHRTSKVEATFLSATLSSPEGYGRVFADELGNVSEIIEDRDCNHEQKDNKLTNAGVYVYNWEKLKHILPKLTNKNEQNELYITDTIKMLDKCMHLQVVDPEEVSGINNRQQLSCCEEIIQQKLRDFWMLNGVTFIDENSCTLSEECEFGNDVIIEPQTHFRGRCQVGNNCTIGPGSLLKNCVLGNFVKVMFSVINDAKVGNNVEIGPYSHLRPKALINDECKIGNFVEVKKSFIGQGTKINHLSYIGDADLGKNVNIGAGTITANYDGKYKHLTKIGNNSNTGANSVLVAPIVLGADITVGAGSTLTKDVPNGSLAIGRAKQFNKEDWEIKKNTN
ncbi:bifunctional UDP-N-acetylglucosamine diphosphorylase/glucosamine-1-phosphate N-acetyltransferase GlmU [Prochlorococcus sp. MIT 1307]|uniref:bifunctional UDP-N-acetylglucosamine diphosphorylase/glucosamine-1-phosphate N-acetyltransferase GlmU n=1 Tax=Prochlorococcus sp. MIT 1307 TaxID=3096219 RepID=UPI002A75F758|nr:bifunctional UDP-N-acetylglucosamine diphosphorylase/glucosamine-1-phosphate N-acetyltransferase GlmU [Prochlorococcus sp. MIT 1307]